MAIYHFSAKIIGRSSGRSSVAAAAYRAGARLTDERTGLTHDFTRKQGVTPGFILAPEGAPEWATERTELWNKVEAGEKRKDAQLSREFEIALPNALNVDQQTALVVGFIQKQLVSLGMIVDFSLHDLDGPNNHVHCMATMRKLDGAGFGKKELSWNEKPLLLELRKQWAIHANQALFEAGIDERIDHRSLKDMHAEAVENENHIDAIRLSRLPQVKLGPNPHRDRVAENEDRKVFAARCEGLADDVLTTEKIEAAKVAEALIERARLAAEKQAETEIAAQREHETKARLNAQRVERQKQKQLVEKKAQARHAAAVASANRVWTELTHREEHLRVVEESIGQWEFVEAKRLKNKILSFFGIPPAQLRKLRSERDHWTQAIERQERRRVAFDAEKAKATASLQALGILPTVIEPPRLEAGSSLDRNAIDQAQPGEGLDAAGKRKRFKWG